MYDKRPGQRRTAFSPHLSPAFSRRFKGVCDCLAWCVGLAACIGADFALWCLPGGSGVAAAGTSSQAQGARGGGGGLSKLAIILMATLIPCAVVVRSFCSRRASALS